MMFVVKRGGEDSASEHQLSFNVSSGGVNKEMLEFEISFDQPNYVSIG